MNRETNRVDLPEFEYWKNEIKETLTWISGYKWAVTIFLFVNTMLYWISFIYVEKIPISIASQAVISSIPIVFLFLVIAIAVLVVYLCLPCAIFLVPTGMAIVPNEKIEFDEIFWRLRAYWILIVSLIFVAFVLIDYLNPENPNRYFLIAICCVSLLVFLSLRWLSPNKDASIAINYWRCILSNLKLFGVVAVSIFFQSFIVLLIFIDVFSDGAKVNGVYKYFLVFLFSVVLVLFQLVVAKFLKLWYLRKGFLKKLILSIFGIVFILGLLPGSGAFFLGAILQQTSSGMRSCAVVSWDQTEVPDILRVSGSNHQYAESPPLRILIEVDGSYIVRFLTGSGMRYLESKDENGKKDKSIYFISRAIVARVDDCKKPNG